MKHNNLASRINVALNLGCLSILAWFATKFNDMQIELATIKESLPYVQKQVDAQKDDINRIWSRLSESGRMQSTIITK